eukprot:5418004-Ditylum_brightwellii.AAC.1
MLFKETVKDYVRDSKILKRNVKKSYELVWGQASKALQEKLRGHPNFTDFNEERDVIMLLNAIKAAMYKYDHRKDRDTAVVEATMRFWNLYQGKEMSNLQLYKKFKTQVDIIEENGGNITFHPELAEPYRPDRDMTEEQEEEWKTAAKENRLIKEIHNDQVRGRPKYPATIEDAYKLINTYTDKVNQRSMAATTNGAMSFNTVGEEEKKEDDDQHEEIVPPTGGAKLRPDI